VKIPLSSQQSEEEAVNSLVVEIRVLEGTYNELTARQNMLERALIEGRSALEAVKGLAEFKPKEVLVPIGGGTLLRSAPPDASKVLVSVGAGVVLVRTRQEASAFLDARVKEIENSIMAVMSQRNQIADRLEADRQSLQSMISRPAPPQKT
jgi:prefoldin alpha subunit